ncbi:MAG: metalloregulator ArsR/SmtB family transcription factor [Bacteroidota bacterium]
MGLTKTDAYTPAQNELALILKALAHPARLAILQQLFKVDCCVGKDFTAEMPLAQPTISRHLRELKEAGLILGTVEGVSVSYCINAPRWREVQVLVNELFNAFPRDPRADCC